MQSKAIQNRPGYTGTVDRFLVGRTIGHGMSCTVKMGIDTHNDSKVAIKIFKDMTDESLKLMQTEMAGLLVL